MNVLTMALMMIAVSFAGFVIGAVMIQSKYRDLQVSEMVSETDEAQKGILRSRILILQMMTGTSLTYSILCAFLLVAAAGDFSNAANVSLESLGAQMPMVSVVFCVASLLVSVVKGLIGKRCVSSKIVDPQYFKRCIIKVTVMEIVPIAALLFFLLMLTNYLYG